jgi:hypothetical protein
MHKKLIRLCSHLLTGIQGKQRYTILNRKYCLQSLPNWIKRDQLDVTCFFISLFHAQHVSNVNTSIHRACDYLLSYFMDCIALVRCVLVLWCGFGWGGVVSGFSLKLICLTLSICWLCHYLSDTVHMLIVPLFV